MQLSYVSTHAVRPPYHTYLKEMKFTFLFHQFALSFWNNAAWIFVKGFSFSFRSTINSEKIIQSSCKRNKAIRHIFYYYIAVHSSLNHDQHGLQSEREAANDKKSHTKGEKCRRRNHCIRRRNSHELLDKRNCSELVGQFLRCTCQQNCSF